MGFGFGPRDQANFRELMEDHSSEEFSDEPLSSQDDGWMENPVDAHVEAEFRQFIQQGAVLDEVNRPGEGYSIVSDDESLDSFLSSTSSSPNISYDADDEDSDQEMSDGEAENVPLESDSTQIDTDCTTSCEE